MCGYFWIGFFDFILKDKSFFSPNEYKKNNKIIKTFFLWLDFKKVRMIEIYCVKCKKYKKSVKLKISCVCHKTLLLSSICINWGSEDEKLFMEQESIEILKILGLVNNTECLKKS